MLDTWFGLVLLGLAWLGLAWLGLVWLGLAWFGLAIFVKLSFSGSKKAPQGTATQQPELIFIKKVYF